MSQAPSDAAPEPLLSAPTTRPIHFVHQGRPVAVSGLPATTTVLGWLREQVHAQGRRFDALELARRVTGEELSPRALVRYLRERYGAAERV